MTAKPHKSSPIEHPATGMPGRPPAVALDVRFWAHSGIGTYLQTLAAWAGARVPYLLIGPPEFTRRAADAPRRAPGAGPETRPRGLYEFDAPMYAMRVQRAYPLRGDEGISLHFPHYNLPWRFRGPAVVNVFDLAHWHWPENFKQRVYSGAFLTRLRRREGAMIVAPSDFIAGELTEWGFPSRRLRVVPLTLHPAFWRVWQGRRARGETGPSGAAPSFSSPTIGKPQWIARRRPDPAMQPVIFDGDHSDTHEIENGHDGPEWPMRGKATPDDNELELGGAQNFELDPQWEDDWELEQASEQETDNEALPPQPYFLTIGIHKPRKNFSGLLRVMDFLWHKRKLKPGLVMAGLRPRDVAALERARRKMRCPGRVTLIPQTTRGRLIALMRGAEALVCPSLYEGFGLPVLEAMACGTPVVCSTAPPLDALFIDGALGFDPENAGELADALQVVTSDAAARRDLRARGDKVVEKFAPKNFVEAMIRVYDEVEKL